jgi:hypothetical protein
MARTDLFTRLSVFPSAANQKQVKVEVQTEAYGPGSQAGIHLWDHRDLSNPAQQHAIDVPLQYKGKADNGDDVWQATIDVPSNFDTASMGATAWDDLQGAYGGGKYRLWEFQNHDVKPDGANRLEPIQPGQISKATVNTKAGPLEIQESFHDNDDYPDFSGQIAVTGLTLQDTAGRYAGLNEVKIYLLPDLTLRNDPFQTPGLRNSDAVIDANEENMVTLTRSPGTNTFVAQAPAGQGFMVENLLQSYETGAGQTVSGIELAVVNPQTNEWDKNGDKNYSVPTGW